VRLEARAALERLANRAHLVCHAGYLVDRLALVAEAPRGLSARARDQRHLDVAELFAFAAPAVVATPTPDGIVRALGLAPLADPVATLRLAAETLIARLADPHYAGSARGGRGGELPQQSQLAVGRRGVAALRRPGGSATCRRSPPASMSGTASRSGRTTAPARLAPTSRSQARKRKLSCKACSGRTRSAPPADGLLCRDHRGLSAPQQPP
jgi:hypothetical protein